MSGEEHLTAENAEGAERIAQVDPAKKGGDEVALLISRGPRFTVVRIKRTEYGPWKEVNRLMADFFLK
ncbi:MAG: hypothetical protein ABSH41_03735 [Syntrophobacteraceae bacterium]|jgi:hypothetical protein